jgi:hypothetical protein
MCFQICLYSSHHSEVWSRYSFSVHEDIFLCFSRHAMLWLLQSKSFLRHSVVVTEHIKHEFCHVILCDRSYYFALCWSIQHANSYRITNHVVALGDIASTIGSMYCLCTGKDYATTRIALSMVKYSLGYGQAQPGCKNDRLHYEF